MKTFRTGKRWAIGLTGVAAIGIVVAGFGLVSYRAESLRASEEFRHSVTDTSQPALAGQVVYYRIDTVIGADTSAGAHLDEDSRRLTTDRWVEIGGDGNATRYFARTKTGTGARWQDQLFDGDTLGINFYARPGDGATCGELGPATTPGSSLPFATASELERIGFGPTGQQLPLEVERHLATTGDQATVFEQAGRPGAPHITNRVSFLAWHDETGQILGQWNYGTAEGERILLDSYTITLFQIEAEFPSLLPGTLSRCEGGTESEPSGAEMPAQEISTPTAVVGGASQ